MSIRINTYEKWPSNPYTINTYENTRLKVVQNQHLQKNRGVGCGQSPHPTRGEVPGLQASALRRKVARQGELCGGNQSSAVKSSSFAGKNVSAEFERGVHPRAEVAGKASFGGKQVGEPAR